MVKFRKELKNNIRNSCSQKRVKKETFILCEWFLSVLMDYLNMREIVAMDSAICNKSDRDIWLKCIAKGIGSVSTKIQSYFHNDRPIEWCSNKNVQFASLCLDFSERTSMITASGTSLLSLLCININEFQLKATNDLNEYSKKILCKFAERCSKLKRFRIYSSQAIDRDVTPILSHNADLEDIEIDFCALLANATLVAIGRHCHRLHRISVRNINRFTDSGITALVSANQDLEEIQMDNCSTLTNASVIAIAQNCHKLKKIDIYNVEMMADQGFKALLSSNPGLEEISIDTCPELTDASLIAMAVHCRTLRKISFGYMRQLTDQGIASLVSTNHDLKEIQLINCIELTDVSLIAIAQHCHKLKKIDVRFAANLMTDEGFVALVSNNQDFEEISLQFCPSLTDDTLIEMATHCHKIRKIKFSDMYQITDQGFAAVVSANHDLEEIQFDRCSSLTDASFVAIASNCPDLKIFSAQYTTMTPSVITARMNAKELKARFSHAHT